MQRTDVASTIVDQILMRAARHMGSGRVSLMPEIPVEAARNTEIAELIQRDDKETRETLYGVFRWRYSTNRGPGRVARRSTGGGLSIRALLDPKRAATLDQETIAQPNSLRANWLIASSTPAYLDRDTLYRRIVNLTLSGQRLHA
ncbi:MULTISPECIES: hypothetical protein [Alcaligenaceae]|uniref:Uncharacterized protein n=1 Tax=Bordetella petrii (strain ATCC BAA-461 / DSM 12804 / CCUG 43448 / CIP 107267 / Se-1111R) TaxID=340100 RepID=A9IAB5_BORPD|nr:MULTISPECIES: hypothetical protein [Alcaligenaceae]CAP44567.1 hypothetical protein Bpet4218 [Bordetella petrii]